MTSHKMDRRTFLERLAGFATLAIAGCAVDPSRQLKQDFTIAEYDRWYKWEMHYNGVNPNLAGSHVVIHTFGDSLSRDGIPGVVYKVPRGETMVAAAPGELLLNDAHHLDGMEEKVIFIAHPSVLSSGIFISSYRRLDRVDERLRRRGSGIKVSRGQPIGKAGNNRESILTLSHGFPSIWIDPDQFGLNHSYMDYAENTPDIDELFPNKSLMDRYRNQLNLLAGLRSSCSVKNVIPLHRHAAKRNAGTSWNHVEEFKYLSTLYKFKPDLFRYLSTSSFNKIETAFYTNQPFVLSIPFRK